MFVARRLSFTATALQLLLVSTREHRLPARGGTRGGGGRARLDRAFQAPIQRVECAGSRHSVRSLIGCATVSAGGRFPAIASVVTLIAVGY